MTIALGAIAEGLLWTFMAIGIFISFRILKRPDLTSEGSFPLGAAVASILIVNGVNPFLASLCAFLAGALAGSITGLLMTKLRIPGLLAGILVMTALYSINLRIMGKSNLSLINTPRLTSLLSKYINLPPFYDTIIIAFLILAVIIFLVSHFFKTEYGQSIIATGDNEYMARSMGINTDTMKVIGLSLANGLVGLSGGLISQFNGYADISMGIGTLVIGLAGILIAETFIPNLNMSMRYVSLPIGAIAYRLIIALVLAFGMQPNDLKVISAIVLGVLIAMPNFLNNRTDPFLVRK